MNKSIIKRVNSVANHIIKSNDTIRKTAIIFHVSKSTIHKDIGERLLLLNPEKYKLIKKIMNEHIETRHLKGGESTKQLFLKKSK